MKTSYYVINIVFMACMLLIPAQINNNKTAEDKPPSTLPPEKVVDVRKDSLIRATNEILDSTIKTLQNVVHKKEVLSSSKQQEQKALDEYIKAVNAFMLASGKTSKVVVRSSVKTKLQEGELFIEKDSTCLKTKKPLFGKRRCADWNYQWYLVDNRGNREELW